MNARTWHGHSDWSAHLSVIASMNVCRLQSIRGPLLVAPDHCISGLNLLALKSLPLSIFLDKGNAQTQLSRCNKIINVICFTWQWFQCVAIFLHPLSGVSCQSLTDNAGIQTRCKQPLDTIKIWPKMPVLFFICKAWATMLMLSTLNESGWPPTTNLPRFAQTWAVAKAWVWRKTKKDRNWSCRCPCADRYNLHCWTVTRLHCGTVLLPAGVISSQTLSRLAQRSPVATDYIQLS